MQNKQNISAIILSAGASSRMGTHKCLLEFNENQNFLEKIINEYHNFGCNKIIVVVNNAIEKLLKKKNFKTYNNVKFSINQQPEKGRFSSIKKGFERIENEEFVYISNIDNPFISEELLSEIYLHKNSGDFVVPAFNGKGGHPILVTKKIISAIKKENKNDLNLRFFLSNFKKFKFEQKNAQILLNINTKEKYYDTFKKRNIH